jgi:DNA-directed RNA polymerase sigma subunit (sigma70/sigma32)
MIGSLRIKDYLACMRQIPELSEADLKEAVESRSNGDEWARRLLEERFLPKVIPWVLPYRGRGIEFEPLIEAGNRALLRGLRVLKPGLVVDATDFLERCVVDEVEALVFAPKN